MLEQKLGHCLEGELLYEPYDKNGQSYEIFKILDIVRRTSQFPYSLYCSAAKGPMAKIRTGPCDITNHLAMPHHLLDAQHPLLSFGPMVT
jgi:hypothetical protein